MRHTAILLSALAAGLGRTVQVAPDGIEHKLYDYARARKFPPPETLARKAAELAGGDYPYPSLAAAPEGERVFFTAFRAVAEALEPFHEDDEGSNDASESASEVAAPQTADGTEARDGTEPAAAASETVDQAGQGEAAELADPAADAGGTATVSDQAQPGQEVEQRDADPAADQVDGKSKKKTK